MGRAYSTGSKYIHLQAKALTSEMNYRAVYTDQLQPGKSNHEFKWMEVNNTETKSKYG